MIFKYISINGYVFYFILNTNQKKYIRSSKKQSILISNITLNYTFSCSFTFLQTYNTLKNLSKS